MTHYFKHKARGRKFGTIAGWVVLGIIAAVGLALLFGYGLMWLWNWLMPALFGLATINYWQAVGIFILAKLLFGSGGHNRRGRRKRRSNDHCRSGNGKPFGKDYARWKHYDKFWNEEGEKAYDAYLGQMDKKEE